MYPQKEDIGYYEEKKKNLGKEKEEQEIFTN